MERSGFSLRGLLGVFRKWTKEIAETCNEQLITGIYEILRADKWPLSQT